MHKYLFTALAAAGALLITACSGNNRFIGSWTASAPVSIAAELPAASSANALVSFDFQPAQTGNSNGTFLYSAVIEASQPVVPDSVAPADAPYEVSVAATASVNGTWTRHDDDELLLSFDMSTVKVDVDPSGVTFSQNMLTGAQQPAVDSLTTRTAAVWSRQIESAVKTSLRQYSKLDDIKVSSDGTVLSFEIKDVAGRDRDVVMHRVISGN